MTIDAIEITVRGFHVDTFGHVNNARFLEFMEDARWAIFKPILMRVQAMNCAMAIVNININYRLVAELYQVLRVDGVITKIGNRSAVMRQCVFCAKTNQLIADADITFVVVDNCTGKAIPLKDEWRTILADRLIEEVKK